MGQNEEIRRLWVLSPTSRTHVIKETLDSREVFDRASRIIHAPDVHDFQILGSSNFVTTSLNAVPTTLLINNEDVVTGDFFALVVSQSLRHVLEEQGAVLAVQRASVSEGKRRVSNRGPLRDTVQLWLESLSEDLRRSLPCLTEDLLRGSWSLQSYPPLLLLPATTFASAPWKLCRPQLQEHFHALYIALCERMSVSHIAINAPIPSHAEASGSRRNAAANAMRSPLKLQPLHGDFGNLNDTADDEGFRCAFWATACQNGIHQVFAPLHTMFSRGNIKEKARVLSFPCVKNTTAVDLYAGIGYFAFSYVKAGAAKVLCWEINPWSVEGFRRGAQRNGWKVKTLQSGDDISTGSENDVQGAPSEKLWLFAEDNAYALRKVTSLRDQLPPIRHVNCGYLPSSKAVWQDALQILDPESGGWIHAHENVAESKIDERAAQIETLMASWQNATNAARMGCVVRCEHVERVKSFAPGVFHCVFDIFKGPQEAGAGLTARNS